MGTSHWVELQRTEVIFDCLDPDFVTKVRIWKLSSLQACLYVHIFANFDCEYWYICTLLHTLRKERKLLKKASIWGQNMVKLYLLKQKGSIYVHIYACLNRADYLKELAYSIAFVKYSSFLQNPYIKLPALKVVCNHQEKNRLFMPPRLLYVLFSPFFFPIFWSAIEATQLKLKSRWVT